MIKFFRNIRRQLLGENKTGKYFKYAIGEILLVVIGILIALQVNNWNEKRKEGLLETEMLEEIKVGLLKDISDISFNITRHKEILNSQNILIEWLDSNKPYKDTLSYHFAVINGSTVFVSNEAPYATLNEIGIRLISNDSLRNKIASVYDRDFDYYYDHIIMYNDLFLKGWKDYNVPYFEGTYPLFIDQSNRMKPLEIEKIRRDNDYKYHIKSIAQFNAFYIRNIMQRAKKGAEELVDMIDKELNKK